MSFGEEKIASILTENGIIFEREKTFDDCRSSITNRKFKFDFWVDDSYIVEYDGRQHFTDDDWTFGRYDPYSDRKARDELKNKWCFDNGIPIIRIPYTHYQDLSIEDLLLKTSPFIVSSNQKGA